MSYRLSRLRRDVSVVICTLLVAQASWGQPATTPAPSKPAEAPKQPSPGSETVSRYKPKKDGLRQLEEDLFRPLESIDSGSPLDNLLNVPPQTPNRSASPSRKARLQDEHKNWGFMSPEELMGLPTPEDLANGPQFDKDGWEKKSPSLLEQYYQRQEQVDAKAKKPRKPDSFSPFDSGEFRDDSSSSAGAERLRDAKQSDRIEPGDVGPKAEKGSGINPGVFSRPNTFSDIFGQGHHEPTPEELLVHKERMQEFQQILDANWRSPGLGEAPGATTAASPSSGMKEAGFASGVTGSSPAPLSPNDPNAASLGIASLTGGITDPLKNLNAPTVQNLPAAPKPPPSLLMQSPSFMAPRRQF